MARSNIPLPLSTAARARLWVVGTVTSHDGETKENPYRNRKWPLRPVTTMYVARNEIDLLNLSRPTRLFSLAQRVPTQTLFRMRYHTSCFMLYPDVSRLRYWFYCMNAVPVSPECSTPPRCSLPCPGALSYQPLTSGDPLGDAGGDVSAFGVR